MLLLRVRFASLVCAFMKSHFLLHVTMLVRCCYPIGQSEIKYNAMIQSQPIKSQTASIRLELKKHTGKPIIQTSSDKF